MIVERPIEWEHSFGWSENDRDRLRGLAPMLLPYAADLTDDFRSSLQGELDRKSASAATNEKINSFHELLARWITGMLGGQDEQGQTSTCFQIGAAMADIGYQSLDWEAKVTRFRRQLLQCLRDEWCGDHDQGFAAIQSLSTRVDIDLAIIRESLQTAIKEQQQQPSRVDIVKEVAGHISYQFHEPLTLLLDSVAKLRSETNLTPEKLGLCLGQIQRRANDARQLYKSLSDFSKLSEPTLQKVDIQEAITPAVTDHPMPSNIVLSVDVTDAPTTIIADIQQIHILLENLLQNALEAMPSGGELMVSAQSVDGHLWIAVSDTGIGISRDDLTRIVEPLYTTKVCRLGLGLAICHGIVQKHHGEMTVVSCPGQGSKFLVKLPIQPRRSRAMSLNNR